MITGLAFNINAFVAIWIGLMSGISMFVTYRSKCIACRAYLGLAMLGSFTIFSLPTIFWIAQAHFATPEIRAFNYAEYLRLYYPGHSLIDTKVGEALYTVMLVMLLWGLVIQVDGKAQIQYQQRLKVGALSLTGILVFGAVLPYLSDSRLANNLFPLRTDSILYWLIIIGAGAWIVDLGKEKAEHLTEKVGVWSALFTGNALLALLFLREGSAERRRFMSTLFLLSSAVALLIMFAEEDHWIRAPAPLQGEFVFLLLLLQALVIGVVAGRNKSAIRMFGILPIAWGPALYHSGSLSTSLPVAGLLMVSVLATFKERVQHTAAVLGPSITLLLLALDPDSTRNWIALMSQVAFWIGVLLYGVSIKSEKTRFSIRQLPVAVLITLSAFGFYRTVERGGFRAEDSQQRDLAEAQIWARGNTDPGTVFLPIGIQSFMVLSRRPVWVDWKQGATVMWAPEMYQIWAPRYRRLKQIANLTDAFALAREEDIPYIAVRKTALAGAEQYAADVSFENHTFVIYRVKPGSVN
jgi:hypothetical protein